MSETSISCSIQNVNDVVSRSVWAINKQTGTKGHCQSLLILQTCDSPESPPNPFAREEKGWNRSRSFDYRRPCINFASSSTFSAKNSAPSSPRHAPLYLFNASCEKIIDSDMESYGRQASELPMSALLWRENCAVEKHVRRDRAQGSHRHVKGCFETLQSRNSKATLDF